MSYIPSHAMPHAYANDEDEDEAARKRRGEQTTTALKIGGAALVGWLLYRALR